MGLIIKLVMKMIKYLLTLFFAITLVSACANDTIVDPSTESIVYSNPIQITINGYNSDAMEPFISPDGNTLFFNSINDGNNTKIYYATKVNNATFTFEGELDGANETQAAQLNAVADLDALNNFYWTSVRDYPAKIDNLHHGIYTNGAVYDMGRVQGDFYNTNSGWLVMDHGISHDGQFLYFNNARFDDANCVGPCETFLGIAKMTGDKNFMKIANSDDILQNINNANYIYYAPCITTDNLELYYTRFADGTVNVNTVAEICVATRTSATDSFSVPKVLFSNTIGNGIIEAPTLTSDKQLMYYHQKVNGIHVIMMRTRDK